MRFLVILLTALGVLAPALAQEKEKLLTVSWGDVIYGRDGVAQLDTPEKAKEAVRRWKTHGIDKVLFRVDSFRQLLFADLHLDEKDPYLKAWGEATKKAWADGLLETAVNSLKSVGIQVFMWITPTDEGRPPDAVLFDFGDGSLKGFWPWHMRFTKENPRYLVHDRSLNPSGRKFQWHVMEYAYPEVRRYQLEVIRRFSDNFNFDGIFLSIRSHGFPPVHADEYGFNQPIVQEYQRRYGRDILREDFDVEKWRELRGEYFTLFLREVKAHLRSTGQKLSIGVQQGEYIGPPFGNMRIEWRRWVSEGIIDELVLGHITRVRTRFPDRSQRTWGYLQNQESGLGLPPIEEAVRNDYGPFCKRHGVKLYIEQGNFYRHHDHPAVGRASPAPEAQKRLIAALEAIPEVTGLSADYMKATHQVEESR